MRIDLFDYALPEELIAAEPPEKRDGGRLLGVGLSTLRDGTIQELATVVTFLASFLRRDTAMGPRKLVTALKDAIFDSNCR